MKKRKRAGGCAAVLLAATAPITFASTDTWNGPTGKWSTPASWSLGHAPASTDAAILSNAAGSQVDLTLDTSAAVTQFVIDAKPTGNVVFHQSDFNLTSGSLVIGSSRAATLFLSGGTQTITSASTNAFLLGYLANSNGTLNQSAGTLSVASDANVAYGGNGTVNLSGGLFSVDGTTYLATQPGAIAYFNLSGGTHTTGSLRISGMGSGSYAVSNGATLSVASLLAVGDGNDGDFIQTGGSASVGSLLLIGNLGQGSFTLGGGTFDAHNANTQIGSSNFGTFTQNGGTFTTSALSVGIGGGGQIAVLGGSFNVTGNATIGQGAAGFFTQSGGSVTANTVALGSPDGGNGTMTLSGGMLSTSSLFLGGGSSGPGGIGTLTVSNAASLNVAGTLKLYTNVASTVINLGGGTLSAGSLDLGGNLSRLHWTTGTLAITGTSGLAVDSSSLTGGNWTVGNSQSLNVTNNETISGSIVQNGGTHTVGGLATITPTGSYTFAGGTFNGAMSIAGLFSVSGGTFNGSLTLQSSGTMSLSTTFLPTGGCTVSGSVTIPLGTQLGGGNIDIEGGVISLSNGSLGGAGGILNNGTITGFGTISGGLANNASLLQGGGNLSLANAPSVNNGQLTLASGRQLQLNAALTNAGALSLQGALVTGTSALTNVATGTITGAGYISVPFSNAGTLLPQAGTLNVMPTFTNTGVIQLAGPGSSLNGGGVVNNSTIQGAGAVGSPVTNNATIEPTGGTLTFSSSLTNNAAGLIRAATGNILLLTAGPFTNAGTLSLTGGTFDAGSATVINDNQITGYGTFAAGNLINNSNLTLAGGTATINGPLTNAASGTVHISQTPAIFTSAVQNDGTFIVTTAAVTFAAGLVNNGIYISDPSTTTADNFSIGFRGALVGGAGDKFVTAGNFISSSTQRATWNTTDATLKFISAGTATSHIMTLTSSDAGGYQNNFAWGTIELSPNQSLLLQSDVDHPALYISILQLDGVTPSQLPNYITTHLVNTDRADPANVYYDPNEPANAYLMDQTYALGNGGELAPVAAPEPYTLVLTGLLPMLSVRSRRRTRVERLS